MLKRLVYAWTPEDEAKLKELAQKGVYLRHIAIKLKRSESSIKKRAREIGVALKSNPRYGARDLGRDGRTSWQ